MQVAGFSIFVVVLAEVNCFKFIRDSFVIKWQLIQVKLKAAGNITQLIMARKNFLRRLRKHVAQKNKFLRSQTQNIQPMGGNEVFSPLGLSVSAIWKNCVQVLKGWTPRENVGASLVLLPPVQQDGEQSLYIHLPEVQEVKKALTTYSQPWQKLPYTGNFGKECTAARAPLSTTFFASKFQIYQLLWYKRSRFLLWGDVHNPRRLPGLKQRPVRRETQADLSNARPAFLP